MAGAGSSRRSASSSGRYFQRGECSHANRFRLARRRRGFVFFVSRRRPPLGSHHVRAPPLFYRPLAAGRWRPQYRPSTRAYRARLDGNGLGAEPRRLGIREMTFGGTVTFATNCRLGNWRNETIQQQPTKQGEEPCQTENESGGTAPILSSDSGMPCTAPGDSARGSVWREEGAKGQGVGDRGQGIGDRGKGKRFPPSVKPRPLVAEPPADKTWREENAARAKANHPPVHQAAPGGRSVRGISPRINCLPSPVSRK